MKRKIRKLSSIKKKFLFLGLYHTFKNFILFKIFKFNSWHIKSNYFLRPYKREVVNMINSFEFDNAIEIGCGLCEIISRINCKKKIAIDLDQNIIKASKFIFKDKINLIQGSIFDDDLRIRNLGYEIYSRNLLICINWPHEYEFNKFLNAIKLFSIKYKVNYLIIDLIDNNPNNHYKYVHTKNDLFKIGRILSSKKISNSLRSIYLIKIDE